MHDKPVSLSKVIMTELVLPTHTNSLGTIFGGVVMSWIDICAAICAQRHAGKEVVTASIDQLDFIAPVYKGWVVNLQAQVNFVSNTSMEIGVCVDAENPRTNEVLHTASAYLTFVAIGSDGKPSQIPKLILETPEDQRRNAEALARKSIRRKK